MFQNTDLIVIIANRKEASQMYFAHQILCADEINHILIKVGTTGITFNYLIQSHFFNMVSPDENLLYSGSELIDYLEKTAETHNVFAFIEGNVGYPDKKTISEPFKSLTEVFKPITLIPFSNHDEMSVELKSYCDDELIDSFGFSFLSGELLPNLRALIHGKLESSHIPLNDAHQSEELSITLVEIEQAQSPDTANTSSCSVLESIPHDTALAQASSHQDLSDNSVESTASESQSSQTGRWCFFCCFSRRRATITPLNEIDENAPIP